MPIRTTERDVPSEFRPARLFLDDIGEIVAVLCELAESQKPVGLPDKEEPKTQILFSTGEKESNDIHDLVRIVGRNRRLSIEVEKGWNRTSLIVHPWFGTTWSSSGFTKEQTWDAYHKLESIIDNRKSRWRRTLHSCPWWLGALLANVGFILLVPLLAALDRLLLNFIPPAVVYPLLFVMGGILISIIVSGIRDTTISLRNSWDPSPLTSYLKDRLIPVALGALIGLAGTLLGLYLKHKYWP